MLIFFLNAPFESDNCRKVWGLTSHWVKKIENQCGLNKMFSVKSYTHLREDGGYTSQRILAIQTKMRMLVQTVWFDNNS